MNILNGIFGQLSIDSVTLIFQWFLGIILEANFRLKLCKWMKCGCSKWNFWPSFNWFRHFDSEISKSKTELIILSFWHLFGMFTVYWYHFRRYHFSRFSSFFEGWRLFSTCAPSAALFFPLCFHHLWTCVFFVLSRCSCVSPRLFFLLTCEMNANQSWIGRCAMKRQRLNVATSQFARPRCRSVALFNVFIQFCCIYLRRYSAGCHRQRHPCRKY